MQRGLLNVTRSISALHSMHNIAAGPSRLAQMQTRHASSYNPFHWIQEKLAAQRREKESQEQVQAAKEEAKEEGHLSLFEQTPIAPLAKNVDAKSVKSQKTTKPKKGNQKHKYSTTYFKISPRKLNMLGNQIIGKPIDYAILQMQFSEKRASTRIMNMLATAKDHASRYKHLDQSKLVVAEAWVNKGKVIKRIEPRGRGRMGIRKHKQAKMHVLLKEGQTIAEKKEKERAYKLNRIVSAAAAVREDKPLRNPGSNWSW